MIVITPTFFKADDPHFRDRDFFLQLTVSSVEKAGGNVLHIIVDDGSDESYFRSLAKRYGGSKTRIVVQRPRKRDDLLTCSNALNYGVTLSLQNKIEGGISLESHSHLCFLHSDDIAVDLAKRIDFVESRKLDFAYTDAALFFTASNKGLLWRAQSGEPHILREKCWVEGTMPYPTMTWSKALVRCVIARYGTMLDPSVGCGEDVDLFLKTLALIDEHRLSYGYLPEITAGYRIHPNSLANIRNQQDRKREEKFVIQRHYGNFGAFSMYMKRLIKRPETFFPILQERASRQKVTVDLGEYLTC